MYSSRDVNSVSRELNRKSKGPPSFSSTLLDDIYRSIDDGSARSPRDKERDGAEKWIEKTKKKKSGGGLSLPLAADTTKLHYAVDNDDALFFSSGSNSSDSNSSLFSNHHDSAKSRSSCFLPPKPKPIRTKTILTKTEQERDDEYGVVPKSTTDKSRALKMYAHLKKMKQPISPGMKLTTFINSILHNSKPRQRGAASDDRSNKSTTKCSSATSFGRSRASYLNQQTTTSSGTVVKMEAERPRTLKLKRDDEVRPNSSKVQIRKAVDADDDEVRSSSSGDCSEDLFEIDHLKLRFELPLYETTASKSNTTLLSSTTNQIRRSNFKGRG